MWSKFGHATLEISRQRNQSTVLVGVRVPDFGFRVSGFGFRVSGFGFGVHFRVSLWADRRTLQRDHLQRMARI